ncbi:hypothetical protein MRX96_024111 [Rhipicephalus microplus]
MGVLPSLAWTCTQSPGVPGAINKSVRTQCACAMSHNSGAERANCPFRKMPFAYGRDAIPGSLPTAASRRAQPSDFGVTSDVSFTEDLNVASVPAGVDRPASRRTWAVPDEPHL